MLPASHNPNLAVRVFGDRLQLSARDGKKKVAREKGLSRR